MDPFPSDDHAILHQAADRARRLLDHLVHNRTELETMTGPPAAPGPPTTPIRRRADDPSVNFPSPGLLAEGEAVLRRATESTRRLADDLRAAADLSQALPPSTPPAGA